ncbi:MAG: MFS transporter [Deltaproteobacteria bacterium]|nr:MFS transporter [Deltaproteobacteria bacterium]
MALSTLTPRLQRLALFNVCLGQFMSAVDSRSVIVALPTISLHFGLSLAVVQWIPLAYQLTIVGLVLSMARLGDRLGRKKVYAAGFLLLAIGSTACGLSGYFWLLILFRIVEAAGGAMILANGRSIASTLYANEGRGRALGMMSMAFHVGYIAGPSLGGFLVDTVGWRWTFFMIAPIALLAGYMSWRILPESNPDKGGVTIDPLGMIALLSVFVSLILGLQQIAKSGFGAWSVVLFAVSAVSLWLLVRHEGKTAAPLLDLSLFKIRLLTASVLSHFFVTITHASTFFLLPFYLQGILHVKPTQVGLTIIFFSLVIVCLAPLGGWLGDKLGSRSMCTVGAALTVLAMIGFSGLNASSTQVSVMVPLMLLGFAWSFFQSPNLSGMFNAVDARHVGSVSGLSLTSANVGNAVGVALGSMLFLRWLNYFGLEGATVPPYTEWGASPELFIKSFHSSWLVIAGLGSIAIVTCAIRGAEKKTLE